MRYLLSGVSRGYVVLLVRLELDSDLELNAILSEEIQVGAQSQQVLLGDLEHEIADSDDLAVPLDLDAQLPFMNLFDTQDRPDLLHEDLLAKFYQHLEVLDADWVQSLSVAVLEKVARQLEDEGVPLLTASGAVAAGVGLLGTLVRIGVLVVLEGFYLQVDLG